MQEEKNFIISLIKKYAKEAEIEFNTKKPLVDLGFTSLPFVCLILELENNFDIEFTDDLLDMQSVTADSIVNYVCERMSKNEKK